MILTNISYIREIKIINNKKEHIQQYNNKISDIFYTLSKENSHLAMLSKHRVRFYCDESNEKLLKVKELDDINRFC